MPREKTTIVCDCGREFDKERLSEDTDKGDWHVKSRQMLSGINGYVEAIVVYERSRYCPNCWLTVSDETTTCQVTIKPPEV